MSSFLQAVAGVIPVLLLATFWDQNYLKRLGQSPRRWLAWVHLAMVVITMLCLFGVLWCLYSEASYGNHEWFRQFAFYCSLVGVLSGGGGLMGVAAGSLFPTKY
ncbi:hypothetical protein WG915_04860 [Corynebacterium sp. H128]|uniref:hypothetical protein n=1 Tax=Corynebacterium sp. H128 TaxID=3133427 RepID=UPI0030A19F05